MAILQPFLAIFFATYMIIFHKTEVQTVILRCLTRLNLIWFTSYDTNCKYFHFRTWLTCEKLATDKWPFYEHFCPYFCQLYVYLSLKQGLDSHLRCLTNLNLNWYKRYNPNCIKNKNAKKSKLFFYKIAKKTEMEVFAFCVITFEPIKI